jgi:hypothetical protein
MAMPNRLPRSGLPGSPALVRKLPREGDDNRPPPGRPRALLLAGGAASSLETAGDLISAPFCGLLRASLGTATGRRGSGAPGGPAGEPLPSRNRRRCNGASGWGGDALNLRG